ncbi:catalase-related domain-containing protein [Streptosporangium canum]|uniref:catalase-related domain-containing protein n=1 Tax=Streptosporangium canum TaxID=324952 RepID=UPI000A68ECBD
MDGNKIRKRSESFGDHYSQATLFWNSIADWEKEHIVAAFRFELGKVDHVHIREGVVRNLNQVDHDLAVMVAEGVGVEPPAEAAVPNHGHGSPALSQGHDPVRSVATRKIAILAADGVDAAQVEGVRAALTPEGAVCEVLAARDGAVQGEGGEQVPVTAGAPRRRSRRPVTQVRRRRDGAGDGHGDAALPGGSHPTGRGHGGTAGSEKDPRRHGLVDGQVPAGVGLVSRRRVHPRRPPGLLRVAVADRRGGRHLLPPAGAAHRGGLA